MITMYEAESKIGNPQDHPSKYKKPLIYIALIGGGAAIGGVLGYEVSHEVFKRAPESPELQQHIPGIIRALDAAVQATKDNYSTLAGILIGGTSGSIFARKLTKKSP